MRIGSRIRKWREGGRRGLLLWVFLGRLRTNEDNVEAAPSRNNPPSAHSLTTELDENRPSRNMAKLANPSPSERGYLVPSSVYAHASPAPASTRTLTTVRSIIRRTRSKVSTSGPASISYEIETREGKGKNASRNQRSRLSPIPCRGEIETHPTNPSYL